MNKFFERFITLLAMGFLTFAVLFTMHVKADDRPTLPTPLEGFHVEKGWEWFPSMPNYLFFVGSIMPQGGDERTQLVVLKEMLELHPTITTVVLHSGGGSVGMAATMSRVIFEKGLVTYVPRDATCASACGYLWLAGKVRVLDGTLGAHRISVGDMANDTISVGDAYEEIQKSIGSLMGWMYEYNVPVLYYAWMLLTPAEEMYEFTEEEEAELVTGYDNPSFDPVDNFVALKYMYLRALQEWRVRQDAINPAANGTTH